MYLIKFVFDCGTLYFKMKMIKKNYLFSLLFMFKFIFENELIFLIAYIILITFYFVEISKQKKFLIKEKYLLYYIFSSRFNILNKKDLNFY